MAARPAPALETWIVTDGAAGNLRPAQALAGALGGATHEWVVRLAPPWRWLAPRLRVGAGLALPAALRDAAARRPPDLVVGCGRRAALATQWLRRAHGAFAVQILDPRADPAHWDVVVAPAHDGLHAPNALAVTGALHAINGGALAEAALRHADLARAPTPRTAVLIGGPTRAAALDRAWLDGLCAHLRAWHAAGGGGLLVTTSRRTPASWTVVLREQLASIPSRIWTGDADGPNPYLGMLAHAQRLVVSPDSANLLAEACATGKPVYVHAPQPVRGRLAALHRELLETGRIRPLRDHPADWTPPTPRHELAGIAAEIRRRFDAARRSVAPP
jgi:hypothetical protein